MPPTPTPAGEDKTPTPMTDHRSPLAIARDEYLGSESGFRSCDPTTLGAPAHNRQYLTNRITSAWLAGAEYANASLERRISALEGDKRRLDFLQDTGRVELNENGVWFAYNGKKVGRNKCLRSAIDAALSAASQPSAMNGGQG